MSAIRAAFGPYPMPPALKATIAHYRQDAGWSVVRPPLVELSEDPRQQLIVDLEARGFTIRGPSGPDGPSAGLRSCV